MNKTAIKNFAIWARNKLIADISYRAGLMGITADGIQNALIQSTGTTEFYDIGTSEPYAIAGDAVKQRRHLVELIRAKERETNYRTAYKYVLEEVAYTWFNRLIAVRFMEVNDYLPSHIRVLSSDSGKMEPDLVTTPFDAELSFTRDEEQLVYQLKQENKIDELFRALFIKQCNALNEFLPALFEKTSDYTELLLNLSVIDQDGVVYHLVHDIPEEDFDVERGGQVEIIGWLYQYYNDERKNEVININKSIIEKDDIPAATQLFTTDWVVRYIVDNSLGRFWLEHHHNSLLDKKLKYFVPVRNIGNEERDISIRPEDIKVMDPCMGSGHFLVYAFEVLMEIYLEAGYSERDAAKCIIENNLYGLDIDDRAAQLAYFAVIMKARQYNRRILSKKIKCNIYSIQESNGINNAVLSQIGLQFSPEDRIKTLIEIQELIEEFHNAKEYGSILDIKKRDWKRLRQFIVPAFEKGQLQLDYIGVEEAAERLQQIINVAEIMSDKYEIVVTNPPYFNKYSAGLKQFVLNQYKDFSGDLFSVFIKHNLDLCIPEGYAGYMTPFVWMFIKTYEKLRTFIINKKHIVSLIQMEYSAFEEATVPICSFILQNTYSIDSGIYLRLTDFKGGMEIQRKKVIEGLNDPQCEFIYAAKQNEFLKIPGTPIAYWLSSAGYNSFLNGTVGDFAETKQGFKTGNNDVFLRLWYEVDKEKTYFGVKKEQKKWFPCNKGGDYRKWYGNNDYAVDWENDGYRIVNYRDNKGKQLSRPQNLAYNFREALTWTSISSGDVSFRYSSDKMMFESKGSECFPINGSNIYLLCGFLNSCVAMYFFKAIAPTIDYSEGSVVKLPFLYQEDGRIEKMVIDCIGLCKEDWDSFETSWDFKRHPLI